MNESLPQQDLRGIVQTTRIIVLAMGLGVLAFGSVTLILGLPDLQAPLEMLTMLSVFAGILAAVMSLIAPRFVVAEACRKIAAETGPPSGDASAQPAGAQTDAAKLAAAYQTKTIVAAAVLEGAAFFALVVYMVERHVASLAVAAVLLLGLLAHIPTTASVEGWISDRLGKMRDQRRFLP